MSEKAEQKLPQEVLRHRDRILELAAERGANNVRLFGSLLYETPDEGSDIDILVDLEPGRSLLDLGGLQMALQELLERPVDLKTPGFLREDIRDRVEKEAIEL
jgi:predicted nucleotidyltransferase